MKGFIVMILILGGLAPLLCVAQTGNFWTFGTNIGLDFGSVPPKKVKINFGTQQGISYSSSAISDCDGNLLFYASDDVIFNAKGDTMDNGLLKLNWDGAVGGIKIGQSAIILIPKPNFSYRYLLFYMNVPDYSNSKGLNSFLHAEIDMAANNGLGKVVFKDSLIGNMHIASCNLDVVQHANGVDFWLITTPNENTFHCYKIDCNGLIQSPILSYGLSQIHNIPASTSQADLSQYGNTKFTRDGKYLIVTGLLPTQSTASVLRYDFDASTGKISNSFPLVFQSQLPANHTTAALEISPNNEIAYFTSKNNLVSANVTEQYLWRVNITTRANFKAWLNSHGATFSLNLGPDNKIYFVNNLLNPPSVKNYPALHYITDPNKWGLNIGIGYLDTISYWELFSLPRAYVPVYDYNFSSAINGNCVDTVSINYTGDSTFKKITVYYGDGDSTVVLPAAMRKQMAFKHRYTTDGKKIITLKLETYFCNSERYLKDSVFVKLKPTIDSLSIASIAPSCSSDTAQLRVMLRSTDSLHIGWSGAHTDSFFITKNAQASSHTFNSAFAADTLRQIYLTAKNTNGCATTDSIVYTPKRLRTDTVHYGLSGFRNVQFTNETPLYAICREDVLQFADSTNSLAGGALASALWSKNYTNSNAISFLNGAVNQTYIITDTNALGCVATDTFKVMVYESPVADFEFTSDTICLSDKEIVANNKTTYSDLSKITSQWYVNNIGENTTSGKTDFAASPSMAGTYKISLVSTSELGCADTLAKNAVVLANPVASYTWVDSLFCTDKGSIHLASDSTVGFTSSWSLNGLPPLAATNYVNTNLPQGASALQLISTDAFGCSDTADIRFTVNQQVKTALSAEQDTFCAGQEQIKLGLTANISDFSEDLYSAIYSNNQLIENRKASYLQELVYPSDSAGNFTFRVITNASNNQCADTQQIRVTVLESPQIEKLLYTAACIGTPITFEYNLVKNLIYDSLAWNFGDGTVKSAEQVNYTYADAGEYKVDFYYRIANGCQTMETVSVQVNKLPKLDFDVEMTSEGADEVNLTLIGSANQAITTWEWTSSVFGTRSGNPLNHTTTDTGFKAINLKVIDANGCENSVERTVPVFPEIEIYVPNAVSPNGDGLNDRLNIVPAYFIKEYTIQIYNRWGQQVYSGNNAAAWQPTTSGVYMYTLHLTDILGKQKNISGTITVVN